MLRYAVVGSGAVGCFYGIRLAAAGAEVQFLRRHDAPAARAEGLALTSPEGDLHLEAPSVAASWAELAPCDVLLVATKTTANSDVLAHLAEHAHRLLGPPPTASVSPGASPAADPARGVRPSSTTGRIASVAEGLPSGILLAQNGIGAEPAFAAAAPGCEVLAGLAFLCSARVAPRRVAHLDYGALTLAAHAPDEAAAGITPLMSAIAADLGTARTMALLDEDLVRARWRKLMWNIAFNPLSVILEATTDAIVGNTSARGLARTLMEEVRDAAAAEGRDLPAGLVDDLLAATARMAPYATSMKLDWEAGRPLELDAMLAEPLRRAARAGVAMPATAVLLAQLHFLEAHAAR